MEIKEVEYKNVYGTLSGKLKFSQGENFLVGINGCGKSTVLNLIRWMLGPNFPVLCTLKHDLIKVKVKHEKYVYSIESRILKGIHEFRVVTKNKAHKFNAINTALVIDPWQIRGNREAEEIQSRYRHLKPEAGEVATYNFLIKELPSPVFIGLERSIDNSSSFQNALKKRELSRSVEGATPLANAKNLMRDAFNTSRRQLVEINDELNKRVLELSFSGVISDKIRPPAHSKENTAKKISQLKSKFESTTKWGAYSKALSAEGVRNAVVKYLDELSSILSVEKKEEQIWVMLNQHNFDRASKMFDLFENHETKAQEVQKEIDNFTREVNRFIGDSGKNLHFDDDTGSPYFKGIASSEILRLAELSSGEAQVVILLSYFAFLAKRGIPIVIDEPELSLHVKWQQYFVSAVKKVMPDECQTIMATHSPEICGAEDVNVQSISVRATQ